MRTYGWDVSDHQSAKTADMLDYYGMDAGEPVVESEVVAGALADAFEAGYVLGQEDADAEYSDKVADVADLREALGEVTRWAFDALHRSRLCDDDSELIEVVRRVAEIGRDHLDTHEHLGADRDALVVL